MPGFDTLGVRLARSRRRLERKRAAVSTVERSVGEAPDGSGQDDVRAQIAVSDIKAQMSARVIVFPRPNRRIQN